jgi:hypothetical protein
LCLLCDYEFSAKKTPRAFVLLTSTAPEFHRAMGNGLCGKCARKKAGLHERVVQYYRDHLFPDLRVL